MPEQFRFNRNDPTVVAALTQNQIAQVRVWQNETSDFQFEFHTQHEAGWPCYLREPNGPNRNLPKMNVREGSWTGQMLQGSSVRDQRNGQEFINVITNNLDAFRRMASRFYVGVEVVNAVASAWFVQFTCQTDKKAKPVFVRLPERGQIIGPTFWSNMQRMAHKPKCPLHRRDACLDGGVLVQLQGQEAVKQQLRYDDNFEVSER